MIRCFRPLFLLIAVVFPLHAHATVNIESIRSGEKEAGLHNRLSFNLAYTEGNTDVTNLKTTLRSDYYAQNYHAFLAASLQRGEKDDERYLNKGFVHLRGMKPVSRRFTLEGFFQHEYNDFTLLEERRLAGAGIRIKAIERKSGESADSDLTLYVGLGLMREKEVIDYPPEVTDNFTRSTNYLSCRWKLDDRVNFTGTLYYQPRLSDLDDYRILFDGGFDFAITEVITFGISVNYRYDSEPPVGVEDYDIEILNGITLSF